MKTPTFPKLKFPWDLEQFNALQKWIDQLRDVFAHGISFRDNMDGEILTFEFTAGSAPKKLVGGSSRPLGVIELSIQQIEPSSNTPPVLTQGFSWTYISSDKSLSFPAYGSIAGTAKYRATVLIVRG